MLTLFEATLENLHNLMLATNTDEFKLVADQSYIGRAALNPNTDWEGILNGDSGNAAVSPLLFSNNLVLKICCSGLSLHCGRLLIINTAAVWTNQRTSYVLPHCDEAHVLTTTSKELLQETLRYHIRTMGR